MKKYCLSDSVRRIFYLLQDKGIDFENKFMIIAVQDFNYADEFDFSGAEIVSTDFFKEFHFWDLLIYKKAIDFSNWSVGFGSNQDVDFMTVWNSTSFKLVEKSDQIKGIVNFVSNGELIIGKDYLDEIKFDLEEEIDKEVLSDKEYMLGAKYFGNEKLDVSELVSALNDNLSEDCKILTFEK